MVNFKEFFLENRDRRIFMRIAEEVEQLHGLIHNSNPPKFEQVFNVSLYCIWKYFDYSVSVLASKKTSKANITYNNLCSLISNKLSSELMFKREIIGQIIEIMIHMGILILVNKDEDIFSEKELFGINEIVLGIAEKEIETLEEFKTRISESENSNIFNDERIVDEGSLLNLYVSSILKQISV